MPCIRDCCHNLFPASICVPLLANHPAMHPTGQPDRDRESPWKCTSRYLQRHGGGGEGGWDAVVRCVLLHLRNVRRRWPLSQVKGGTFSLCAQGLNSAPQAPGHFHHSPRIYHWPIRSVTKMRGQKPAFHLFQLWHWVGTLF